jgi:prepilin signal peptidase PulO-like enzyme (type II secretory pathway)
MVFVFIFIFGLVIGSFLNVLIWRLKTGESVVKGRSHCPKCKHVLGFWDLIPVLSFVIQKGKCRYCGGKISWQYPAVELVTAILFVVAYIQIFNFQFSIFNEFSIFNFQILNLLRWWFAIAVMIVIFVYDLKYSLILDKVIYPAAAVAFLASPLIYGGTVTWHNFFSVIMAAAIGGGFFLLQYLLSGGKWIGGGDVKMGFLMGLILGIEGILVALFFSYVIGALISLGLVAAGKKSMKSQIPFGTFLATGTIIAMFWGGEIVKWYLR